jgi:hypothetical protein
MNNADRADRFATALEAVAGKDAPAYVEQELLIDLLADAMHWCDANGEDFHIALAQACRHYINELNDQQLDERRL